jgi:Protein of unknown function (DUF3089)
VSLAAAGCAKVPPPLSPAPPPGLQSPFTGFASERYRDPKWWLCLPGRDDACARDLTATEMRPDGARVEVQDTRAPGADQVDCFWVYPTVDLSLVSANHTSFADLGPMTATTVIQAARFRYACNVYAPLYRQTTIGTYLRPASREPYRAVAVSDVVDAFLQYMGQFNKGHKIVLIGHSQGGEMVGELLRRFFDDDPKMREKLLLAMPIGWPMDVEPGKTTGGTFAHLPVCTQRGETGCVVSFRSYDAAVPAKVGHGAPSPGRESVCVNPALLAHGKTTYSRSFLSIPRGPSFFPMHGVDDVRTPFVMLRDYYAATCMKGDGGFRYLGITEVPAPGDQRVSPVPLSMGILHGALGYHLLDVQLAEGDLVDLVAERAAALAK